MVEAIFVEEEGSRRCLVPLDVERNVDDVATGAEASALRVIDKDDAHVGVVAPF